MEDECTDTDDKRVVSKEYEKDNAWSVVVLTASLVTQIIVFGLLLCFGIYFVELLEYFKCTKREVAIVGSVAYGTKCLTGLLSSMLYRKFGCRPVVITGGLISSIGCFSSYFANSLFHLYITYGFINGFGLGLAYTPTLGILPDYFDKYRYFATAFATVGSAVGTLLFQPIFLFLIETYGWHGSMLVNAGFSLQIVVCGCLMRSRTVHPHTKWGHMFELSLLKDLKFIFLCLDCILWGGAVFIVFSMANSLVIPRGISKQESTYLVVIIGACNGLGRLSSSFLGHWPSTNRPLLYASSTLIFSLATIASTFSPNFIVFCITLGLFGFFFGAMLAQLAGVLMDVFDIKRLISGLGYTMFSIGIGGISLPPLAGWLIDSTGKIEHAFYVSAASSALASILCMILVYIHERQKLRNISRDALLQERIPDKE